jgi:hypothetical protein
LEWASIYKSAHPNVPFCMSFIIISEIDIVVELVVKVVVIADQRTLFCY